MKTNTPLPEMENIKEPIVMKRKVVTVGEPEQVKKKDHSFLLIILIALVIFGNGIYNNVNWDLAKNIPTIQDKPSFFKTLQSKQYFKSIIIATPIPVPIEDDDKTEIAITATDKKIEIKPAKKQKISFSDNPNYHLYDNLILTESKKYKKVRPIVVKAMIEQESNYNPARIKYESKWERDYAAKVPKKRHENIEEWKMNFHSIGLMQIGYVLHKEFCELSSYTDLYIPEVNIKCGIKIYNACIEEGNSEIYCIKKYNGSGSATEKYKNEVLSRVARMLSVPTKLMS